MKVVFDAIVLRRINYRDNSFIITCFTLQEGMKSFVVSGGKKKSNLSVLHPLSLVEMEINIWDENRLGKAVRVSSNPPMIQMTTNPIKSGIAFFMAELIENCLKSDAIDTKCYEFLRNEINYLEECREFNMYPLYFLVSFTHYLGIRPNVMVANMKYFDLANGIFVDHLETKNNLQGSSVMLLNNLLECTKEEAIRMKINKVERNKFINDFMMYYKYQIEGFKTPKSLAILQVLFS